MFEDQFLNRHVGRRPAREQRSDRPIACTIITAAASVSEEVFVSVTGLGPDQRRGPCKWTPIPQAGGTILMPKGGEAAIMEFDSGGLPWITGWWPH